MKKEEAKDEFYWVGYGSSFFSRGWDRTRVNSTRIRNPAQIAVSSCYLFFLDKTLFALYPCMVLFELGAFWMYILSADVPFFAKNISSSLPIERERESERGREREKIGRAAYFPRRKCPRLFFALHVPQASHSLSDTLHCYNIIF